MGFNHGCVLRILVAVYLPECKFCALAVLNRVDVLALQAIQKALKDLPGSTFFHSWNYSYDPCNFTGVHCNSDKVIALDLGDSIASSPGLTGHLHPAIGNLSSLGRLTVTPGKIFGSIPGTISQLKNLSFLALSRNYLSKSIPESLGQLRSLRTLDLSYNQLTGAIPTSIGALPELSKVFLCHNKLSGPVPTFTSPSLIRLDLKHNQLSGSLGPHSLSSSLQYLSLSSNQLTGTVDWLITPLDRLNYRV